MVALYVSFICRIFIFYKCFLERFIGAIKVRKEWKEAKKEKGGGDEIIVANVEV